MEIRPQPGPQEAFCSSPADIVIYGGAAGGGKSHGLLLEAMRNIHVPGYAAVLFRRTSPELTGGGSIWEESTGLYYHAGGVSREHPSLDWTFRTSDPEHDALIEFRHLQHEKDIHAHQGKQYAFIGFDELTSFTERQFWYLVSRNRSTCGVRPYLRATCNPDPDSFVRRLIDWWIEKEGENKGYPIPERSGVLRWIVRRGSEISWYDSEEEAREANPDIDPISFTFIAARLEDNPALMEKDPSYKGKLEALPYVDRMQLLKGNWDIRPASGLYFRRSMFEVIEPDEVPKFFVAQTRAWDLASTPVTPETPDPDYTIGTKYGKDRDGQLYVLHMEYCREAPFGVEKVVINTAKADGKRVKVAMWQDPGQAGKAQVAHYTRKLMGFSLFFQPASKDKLTFAKPLSSQAEGGNIKVVRGPWNELFFSQLESFPTEEGKGHDDVVDSGSLALLVLVSSALARLKALVKWKKGSPKALLS